MVKNTTPDIQAPTIVKGRKIKTEWLWCYFFIAPLVIGLLIFSVFPLIYALVMSLMDWDGITKAKFIGIQNFITLFKDKTVLNEVKNTFVYAIGVVPATIILALILANLLNTAIHGKAVYRTLYYLPNITMATAVATVWRSLMNTEFGVFNRIGMSLGLPSISWISDPNYIMAAICIVAVWGGVGYASVLLLAGLQGIPKSYYEAARIDGANSWHLFINITVPLLTPTIFFVLVSSLINAFKAFDLIFMFAGKGSAAATGPLIDASRTMVFGIFYRGFSLMRMGYASAEAVLLFALIMLVTVIQFRIQKKWVFYE